jgi:hypothetical protein
MKMKRILIAVVAFLAMQVHAQTPEVDAWKAAKTAEVQAAINAQTDNTNRQLAIQAGVAQIFTRLEALEALVAKLQASGQLTQQQLDQIRLVIPQVAP